VSTAGKIIRQMRATMMLLNAQVELLAELESELPAPCEHNERDRDAGVADVEEPGRWMCKRCGHIGGEKAAGE
jgi:hypothetical protein